MKSRFDLGGKLALVTGGASGIGLATAQMLASYGAKVAVNHLPGDEEAMRTIAALTDEGLNVVSAPGNVADATQCAAMVDAVVQREGRLDYLINNAGTSGTTQPIDFADLDAMTDEFWQLILSTNLLGPFRCARAAAGALKSSGGAIVNTASNAGFTTRGSSLAYAASKAGLINMTRALARALAPSIRVNAVAPGFVETPWTKRWPEARKRDAMQRSFLNRGATPEDIAEVIVFLAVGASYVNGQTIVLDGGSM
ncbi:SDR family oxidoreductase [Bradyrhizobium sp. 15]|uniref:SDR family NAD(P)-dependent oxidoreductase n=1 Tax=Bradyrhizobium sp. 15 TaxID=2782633 RepID=UPI001FF9A372|nr:SDR family oxidoreductase [Bradyrhizobium sp. 15]MCK1440544.1 SDR family oxidoreductase [Bradyrhizobium sp. 15]